MTEFLGHHLVASYSGCDQSRLSDKVGLMAALKDAVLASGATILDTCDYMFPNGAITAVMLLSESHASIHTYPEHGACFVDLFTCGEICDPRKFDNSLKDYLRPKLANTKILLRDANIEELASSPGM